MVDKGEGGTGSKSYSPETWVETVAVRLVASELGSTFSNPSLSLSFSSNLWKVYNLLVNSSYSCVIKGFF